MKHLLAIGLVCLACIGCNSEDAADLKRDAGNLAKTTGETLSNAQLAGRVNGAFANTKDIDMQGLHVEANDGVVTIGGHVHTKEEKDRIRTIAESVKGVSRVVDEIRVESH